jgi:hypothetical protein
VRNVAHDEKRLSAPKRLAAGASIARCRAIRDPIVSRDFEHLHQEHSTMSIRPDPEVNQSEAMWALAK